MPLVLFNPLIGPLSGATTPGQNGPESNGNEGVLRIPQGPSPSDCLVSYPEHSLGRGSYPSAEVQSVYSSAPAGWAINIKNLPVNGDFFYSYIHICMHTYCITVITLENGIGNTRSNPY